MNNVDNTTQKLVHVAVGVIYNAEGKILVAQRAASQHLGGLWEFPGGKVESGESVNNALTRELYEELGIDVRTQTPLCKISHRYSDKSVLLDVWNVQHFDGEPHGREGQPLRWLTADELRYEDFPQANGAIIRAIQLPDYLALLSANADAVTINKISDRLPDKSLIRLRNDGAADVVMQQSTGIKQQELIVQMLHKNQHKVIIDLADAHDAGWQSMTGIHGVHANRHVLNQLTQRPVPEDLFFGASCHNADELQKAVICGADYALLSPVLPSSSHPEQHGMGWEKFEQLARSTDIAVYAMGGLQQSDFEKARSCGARGIAGIRLFNAA